MIDKSEHYKVDINTDGLILVWKVTELDEICK